MRKRTFLIIMLIVVAGGLALFWKYRQATEEPVEVRTITVQKGDLVSSVIAPGRINSERIEVIKAPVEGIIEGGDHLKEGSGVKKGEIIAAIRKLDEELATIRQDLELAEIDLELIQEQKAQAQELLAAKAISQKQLRELEIREYKQEITVANLREKLKEKPIVAPFSGVITKKIFEPGQKVDVGAELLTVVDMSALLTVLWVNEYDISKLRVGQKVILTGDTFSGPLRGRITTISRTADEMGRGGVSTFTVISSIDNHEGVNLLLGSTVEARIVMEEKQGVISVPLEAVLYRDGKQVVFVVEDDVARMRYVTTGISDQKRVEITSGLEVGEMVVTRGNLDLIEDSHKSTQKVTKV